MPPPQLRHLLLLLLVLSAILTHTHTHRPSAGGSQPITVVYAGATRPDIGSLASDLESTLTNVAVSLLPTSLQPRPPSAPCCGTVPGNAQTVCRVMPLYLLQIGTHESFQIIVDERDVGFASLTAPDSCIRELSTVKGGLVRGGRRRARARWRS